MFVLLLYLILQLLTDLLKGSPKVLLWSPVTDASFVAAKAALVAAVPAQNAVRSLVVEASDLHVGDVLQQQVGWKLTKRMKQF